MSSEGSSSSFSSGKLAAIIVVVVVVFAVGILGGWLRKREVKPVKNARHGIALELRATNGNAFHVFALTNSAAGTESSAY